MTRHRLMLVGISLPALLAGIGYGIARSPASLAAGRGASVPITDCRVIDGDTLRCGEERIRLLGIDAPELPGHCRPGRRCAPGNGKASKLSLGQALVGRLRIERLAIDRYGRTLGLVSGARGDLSCWQLRYRQAIYRGDWDNGRRVARLCGASS